PAARRRPWPSSRQTSGRSLARSASCGSNSACTSIFFAPWTSTSSGETPRAPRGTRLFTVGHSTRTLDELVDLLKDHGIVQLVDVRHYPRSRRNPQANQDLLTSELPRRGIAYVWDEDLGGF